MYFITHNEYECSGCTACVNVCTHNAITMEENEEGFLYPVKHADKCIECGLCERVCPFENPIYSNDNPIVYAAYDRKERIRSTSGGLFYTIASHIIRQGGVVYGAAYDENLQVIHQCARTLQELKPLRGSKYVQSNLKSCFLEIKEELNKGTLVYFTGVGCQVAGLYAYLRKNYKNLITSDIVCHGVPNQKLFDTHLAYIGGKYNSKVKSYSFRDTSLWLIREKARLDNGKIKYEYDGNMSPYLYAFGLGYTYRYSCFSCRFAKIPRQGDISLADFWGTTSIMDTSKGVSLVLLNNEKGHEIWEAIKDNLVYQQSDLTTCAKHNPNVIRPTQEPPFRKKFFKMLTQEGYEQMARSVLVCPPSMRNKRIERVMFLRKIYLYQPYYYSRLFLKKILIAMNLK